MSDSSMVLRATSLARTFGESPNAVTAVADASFDVRAGEMVLIMGPSGSGKTTLLSMIGGLIGVTSGEVELAGVRLSTQTQQQLTALRLRQVGFIFQSFRLIDALSVAENVELPLSLAGMRRPVSRRRALELLDELGMLPRANASPRTLSGGEKQRAAIARAFANDPPLILADEPTGSLDSHAGHTAIELLHRAAKHHAKAVVVVTHDPRIVPFADRTFAIEDGVLRPAGAAQAPGVM
jgi:putative ABC transport system ATP-binding protein